ncbi:hypothetical protein HBI56_023740 [Parastagonospora nodorum]|uniref:Uncharacterized protein n=1 Tax=Phaeosphaeria nodorum (strain SN15 / ATCC MYA-4574 / FGSC 10173) TaxID=321614 RepID=A0A7U2F5G0_PHANO|nr:hypothetical protein HBH56_024770 [Parastagonospora nodorum]QRC98826.1 hypothetical protein JI435_061910 [Parastagonospora nodorum SN15]KAH3934592.1 hypothetical protein HBH54_057230 [Parastagonospora nodorum]KAH3975991.1 hypothetical protein HBH51_080430 [Parastagonospora nodorum]KAH4005821.1 hypothetical protein HBI10_028440 [Parastagonospora nodorum]
MKLQLPVLLATLAALAPTTLANDKQLCYITDDLDQRETWYTEAEPRCSAYWHPSLGLPSKIVECHSGKWHTREVCDKEHYCVLDAQGRPSCEGVLAEKFKNHQSLASWAKTATAFPTTKRFPTTMA